MDNSSLLMPVPVLAALVYWLVYSWREETGAGRSLVKTAAVGGLAHAAWGLDAPGLITAGLAFGALGDLALSRPGDRAFLAGMAAFALGHLAYALWFLGSALLPDAPRLLAMAGLLALMLSTRYWLLPHAGALAPAVAAYVGVIGTMGLAALASSNLLALAGAGLFLLSDLLLAIARFRPVPPLWRRSLAIALWPAYWAGQALILLGAAGLWPFHPAP